MRRRPGEVPHGQPPLNPFFNGRCLANLNALQTRISYQAMCDAVFARVHVPESVGGDSGEPTLSYMEFLESLVRLAAIRYTQPPEQRRGDGRPPAHLSKRVSRCDTFPFEWVFAFQDIGARWYESRDKIDRGKTACPSAPFEAGKPM